MTDPDARIRRVVVFDLDDTLYLERTYARSGFVAVDRWARDQHGLTGLFEQCWSLFESGERGKVFDAALAKQGIVPSPGWIDAMIAVYRQHLPSITLAADAAEWLAARDGATGLALISDGFAVAQARKVEALRLADHGFDPILLTDTWGRAFWKPHPHAFAEAERHFPLPASRFVYVADNPSKDFLAPRQRGWRTVQIARPDRIHRGDPPSPAHRADRVIASLAELDEALAAVTVRSAP